MPVPTLTDPKFRIACESEANVLITGPTGSGKTLLARRIHQQSCRRDRPFIVVNLAALHEGTLESELFGHEKGAFTGAEQRRIGRLEAAHGGTVFLDEIGELTPRFQARLLEFLQSRTVSPVGSGREIRLDVRVITATHRDLAAAVRKGEFREDLLHRIRVVPIHLRSLREQADDFNEIVHECLVDISATADRRVLRISEEVADRLEAYHWPGNFRELRNVLEYSVLSSNGQEIRLSDLPDWMSTAELPVLDQGLIDSSLGVAEVPLSLDFQGTLSLFEREYLKRALNRYRGRINQTARKIGMNKTTLLRRVRAYGLTTNRVIS
jgi:DNA-binding NtrC family response regulator